MTMRCDRLTDRCPQDHLLSTCIHPRKERTQFLLHSERRRDTTKKEREKERKKERMEGKREQELSEEREQGIVSAVVQWRHKILIYVLGMRRIILLIKKEMIIS